MEQRSHSSAAVGFQPGIVRVTVLGTGLMGAPMAANLCGSGFDVCVWNRSRAKAEALAQHGARVAETPSGAVQGAHVVILMLQDAQAVEAVLFEAGVANELDRDALVIDMSSIPPAVARDHGRRLGQMGIAYLDAPVSGGTRGAAEATLAIMVGGASADLERARPVFEALGRPTLVGPVGSGQLSKCVNQVIVGVTIGAVAEGILLAAAGGADPAAVREAIRGGFAESRILHEHGRRMIERDWKPGGMVHSEVKDMHTALRAVPSLNLPLTSLASGLYEDLLAAGFGEHDHSALLLALERMNAIEREDHDVSRG